MTDNTRDGQVTRAARWARCRFMRWLTKPITGNEVAVFSTLWLAVYVLWSVSRTRG